MKFLWGSNDGGPESNVRMWGIEAKRLGSILVLHFAPGSREAFHSHAFNAVSWVLRGELHEDIPGDEPAWYFYGPSWRPVHTARKTFHKVFGAWHGAWVFTLRSRWRKTWLDGQPDNPDTLTHGRRKVWPTCPCGVPGCLGDCGRGS